LRVRQDQHFGEIWVERSDSAPLFAPTAPSNES
jgi:hypothetical protein